MARVVQPSGTASPGTLVVEGRPPDPGRRDRRRPRRDQRGDFGHALLPGAGRPSPGPGPIGEIGLREGAFLDRPAARRGPPSRRC